MSDNKQVPRNLHGYPMLSGGNVILIILAIFILIAGIMIGAGSTVIPEYDMTPAYPYTYIALTICAVFAFFAAVTYFVVRRAVISALLTVQQMSMFAPIPPTPECFCSSQEEVPIEDTPDMQTQS